MACDECDTPWAEAEQAESEEGTMETQTPTIERIADVQIERLNDLNCEATRAPWGVSQWGPDPSVDVAVVDPTGGLVADVDAGTGKPLIWRVDAELIAESRNLLHLLLQEIQLLREEAKGAYDRGYRDGTRDQMR